MCPLITFQQSYLCNLLFNLSSIINELLRCHLELLLFGLILKLGNGINTLFGFTMAILELGSQVGDD